MTNKHIPAPWAATDSERTVITEIANSFVGRSLAEVRYMVPASSGSEYNAPMYFDGFDWISVVGMGIEFEMLDGEVFAAVWVMGGALFELSGLSIGKGFAPDRSHENELKGISATESKEWQLRRGRPITRVTLRWVHMNRTEKRDESALVSVWAMTIEFKGAPPATVALGTVEDYDNPSISLSPDNIVVVFDEELHTKLESEIVRVFE